VNQVYFPNDPMGVLWRIPFRPDWAVACAAPDRFHGGFCFGAENGEIACTDVDGLLRFGLKASPSAQPINGLAWSRNFLVATSRQEIRVTGPWCNEGPASPSLVMDIGAFGVNVTPNGHFVLPLGRGGFLRIDIDNPLTEPAVLGPTNGDEMNLYAVAAFTDAEGADVLAFAARRGGLACATFGEPTSRLTLRTMAVDGLDIVDIASLATARLPRAALAASKDGSLLFFDDINSTQKCRRLKFKTIAGSLYRVLVANEDVYLLTSKALYLVPDLARTFREGNRNGTIDFSILVIPIQASDCTMVAENWLLAVGHHEVFRFNLPLLRSSPKHGQTSTTISDFRREAPVESETDVTWRESEMQSHHFAASA
jgi:hypothetical protein